MIGFWPRLPSMHTSRRDSPILRHHYYYLPIHLAIVDIRPHPIQTQKASSERRGLQCGFLRPLILQKYLLSELAPGDVSISPPLPTVATNQSTTPGSAELDNSGCRGFTGPFPPPLWMSVHQYELVDVIIARVSGRVKPPCKWPSRQHQSLARLCLPSDTEAPSNTLPGGVANSQKPGAAGWILGVSQVYDTLALLHTFKVRI